MAKAPVASKLTWNEPALEDLLTVRGGYAVKAYPVKSHEEFVAGHGEVTFVHISKREENAREDSVGHVWRTLEETIAELAA